MIGFFLPKYSEAFPEKKIPAITPPITKVANKLSSYVVKCHSS